MNAVYRSNCILWPLKHTLITQHQDTAVDLSGSPKRVEFGLVTQRKRGIPHIYPPCTVPPLIGPEKP